MMQVAKQYELFGGISPINEQNRKLIAALTQQLETNGPKLPIYWGNRNWHPLLADTVQQMTADGVKHAIAGLLAFYCALLLQLPSPSWALFTVMMLMLADYVGAIFLHPSARVLSFRAQRGICSSGA